ncbi:LolA family protein [Mangrovibacillus cuniculi]|uniref:Outer membrane lipoprotein carrier protein LolA n=1 Tax=Mangrovibacillus cuniculi TaxID=2593652 RepID=A0A7S8HH24_9BACI|nr:outer membrane lipoprotein carrier protein LolA [Mangrovibacillus cuniculi]QPC48186.1 outer membrane lipoprotein carrier protein LolA [Mangrovibacillus cuniculi]
MKKWLVMAFSLILVLALAACGQKTQADVQKDLTEKVTEMKGYKATATMTLQMGEEAQTYEVEVWHNSPSYYRVHLKNDAKQQSQMILKNDEGVFVLTPTLNKSFKFQSEWPENSSQAYLLESLVKDITEDAEATFKPTEEAYAFETKTRYQHNKMLPTQTITFNKKDLSPQSVVVMDTDRNEVVKVEFSKFEWDAKFEEGDFDMQKNMTGAQLENMPVTATPEEEFAVKYPTAEIAGVTLIEEKTVKTENGERVVLTYGGDEKSYTVVQERSEVVATSSFAPTNMNGEVVDLGFTVAAVTDRSITWTYDGVDYMVASTNLTPDEMVMIARSVQGHMVK